MRISDWSSDVCSSDLDPLPARRNLGRNYWAQHCQRLDGRAVRRPRQARCRQAARCALRRETMDTILAAIDASGYATSVCDLAAWASPRLCLPVELLHVVQRKDAVAERHDLSGAIGLGVKSSLLEELTRLEEADARLQVERGRVLLAASEERLRAAGVDDVRVLHRHGGIVETILEREADARVVVIGERDRKSTRLNSSH